MKRAALVLILSFVGLFAFDLAVFHSGFYARILNPDSTAGYLENVVHGEINRTKDSPNQIVAVGDSRMALIPRVANEFTEETGYTYGSLGVAGAGPRAWYYILRAVDPYATRYRAVIVTIETFDDNDTYEDLPNRDLDLNYLSARLGLSDIVPFASSYTDPERQWKVVRGLLFKGLLFKTDFQDFLLDPFARLKYASDARRFGFNWRDGYVGDDQSLAGLEVDWEKGELHLPDGVSPEVADGLQRYLLDPLPPERGERSRYLKEWLGKIQQHYAGSETKLIFLRLPRAPWIRPDMPPPNPNSSIRLLATEPNVELIDEHTFDVLEKPELFRDELHLNQPGGELFTEITVPAVTEILGPPL